MSFKQVKIRATVPPGNANQVRQALGEAGASVIGEYTLCSSSIGTGRFKPSEQVNPLIDQDLL